MGYGQPASEPPDAPPIRGAIPDGTFTVYDDPDERYHRWVVEVATIEDLHALLEAAGSKLLLLRGTEDRYFGCYDLLDGGLDGIVESYDTWRE